MDEFKKSDKKLTMLTCYDFMTAKIIDNTELDFILVGDSLGNVFKGEDSTKSVSVENICYHTKAVKNGAKNSFIFADMPFNSYLNSEQALENAKKIISAGADGVKIEGNHFNVIKTLTENGIIVCGHIGLMPQTATEFKVQGKIEAERDKMIKDALEIERAGAKIIVIECTSNSLAKKITEKLKIPTIGIGAGNSCDGQVLVINDMLGINPDKTAKFVKKFANLNQIIIDAVNCYIKEVRDSSFPSDSESYK